MSVTTAANGPIRVAVIVGSVREGRQGKAVTDWFLGAAAGHGGLELDVIDLADVDLPLVMPGWGGEPTPAAAAVLAGVSPRLAQADAFVVVTPEYNHSFPAALKNVIDWHYAQWRAKPVGFVSYGGLGGGLRAVEQLRLVFAELRARLRQPARPLVRARRVRRAARRGRGRGRGQGDARAAALVGRGAACRPHGPPVRGLRS